MGTYSLLKRDNVIFVSDLFTDELIRFNQELTLSSVGAHHQNGVAERAICTTVELARTMLIHAAMHWPEKTYDNLWPFALDHAIFIHNHTPNTFSRSFKFTRRRRLYT